MNLLEQEKTANKAGHLAETLLRLDLVILDELGYLPFSASGGALLFHLLSKLYERTSVVYHHQPEFQRVGPGVRRHQDDDRVARPAHPSLPHPGNRQRQLQVQKQLGRREDQEDQNTRLTHARSLREVSRDGSILDENAGSVLSKNQQLDDFEEERIADPSIHALMQKITVRATEECNRSWPQECLFRMTVVMNSGERHVEESRYAKGHPMDPLSDSEIEAKFRMLAGPVMAQDRIDYALERLWQLETVADAGELMELFVLDTLPTQ